MTTHSKKEGWSAGAKTALIALPILYVLSIGPVAYTLRKSRHINPQVNSAVNAFYKPLELLYEHTPLQVPLEAYIGWWMERDRRSP